MKNFSGNILKSLQGVIILSIILSIMTGLTHADVFIYKPPKLDRVVIPGKFNRENIDVLNIQVANSGDINAYAAYENGKPIIGIEMGMLKLLRVYSYYIAIGEYYNPQYGLKGTKLLGMIEKIGSGENIPIPDFPPGSQKARIERRADELFNAMVYVVLAHETGHHICGHVRKAYVKLGYNPGINYKKDLVSLMNSRDDEYEPDTVAVILTLQQYGKTGAQACMYFVYLFETAERIQGTPIEFLSTHPNWENRRHYMKKVIDQHKSQYYR
jgi:hypothetical protein